MQTAASTRLQCSRTQAICVRPPARPARLARLARRPLAPVAALDPSLAFVAYNVQEFGLTLMGAGVVSAFAAGTAHMLRNAAGATTAAPHAPAAAPVEAAAPVAKPAPAPVAEQQATPAPAATLELADIKSELQQAAAAAVAAVKSAAAEPAAPAPAKAAAAPAPNGAAVKPGLTVEEATQQVKDWIAAWRGEGEGAAADAPQAGAAEPPTTRVTEPSMPASAAALLSQMTADAPVAATPVGQEAPAATAATGAEEPVLAGAAVFAPAAKPAADDSSAAEKEREYKARISAVMADAKVQYNTQLEQQQARADRVAERMRSRVVQVGANYQAKIESLWQSYATKKAEEAELLAKSERILSALAESEAEERQLLEQATAQEQAASAARRAQQAETELSPLAALVARIVAFFQALQRWFQTLVAFVTGGGSGSGSAAGASA